MLVLGERCSEPCQVSEWSLPLCWVFLYSLVNKSEKNINGSTNKKLTTPHSYIFIKCVKMSVIRLDLECSLLEGIPRSCLECFVNCETSWLQCFFWIVLSNLKRNHDSDFMTQWHLEINYDFIESYIIEYIYIHIYIYIWVFINRKYKWL